MARTRLKLYSCLLSYRQYSVSNICCSYPKLTPAQATGILKTNELTKELESGGSVKSFDLNVLPSNNPLEDKHAIAKCLLTTGIICGVFDGHGGSACAEVVAKRALSYIAAGLLSPNLLERYLQALKDGLQEEDNLKLIEYFNDELILSPELNSIFAKSFANYLEYLHGKVDSREEFQMSDAMITAFTKLDEHMSEETLSSHGQSVYKELLSVALSGCVACVAHIDGPHLHIASTGDCGAVLGIEGEGGTWVTKKLTDEHNYENYDEVKRILSEHPQSENHTILRNDRLFGQLAPLRAFGDFRYKWDRKTIEEVLVPASGLSMLPPHYHTPPYLTVTPSVTYHRLTAKDKFLVVASDGLWDQMSPSQVVRLIGEHMSGRVTLTPLSLPKKPLTLGDIEEILVQRRKGLAKKPIDVNGATHLIRNAIGGTEYGIEHTRLSQMLTLPDEIVRVFRDDITIIIIYFNSQYLRNCRF